MYKTALRVDFVAIRYAIQHTQWHELQLELGHREWNGGIGTATRPKQKKELPRPSDEPQPAPVKEPPDKPVTTPDAPVDEPESNPPECISGRIHRLGSH